LPELRGSGFADDFLVGFWGMSGVGQVLDKTVECDHLPECPTPDLDYGTTGRWFDNEFVIAESIASGRNLRPLEVA
jgi:hypothetical protein